MRDKARGSGGGMGSDEVMSVSHTEQLELFPES